MNAPSDLPQHPVSVPHKPCSCGGVDFSLYQRGPNIGRQCITCGEYQQGWIARHEVGLGKRVIRREAIAYDIRADVLQRWQHRCAWCGISSQQAMLVVGHILPRAKLLPLVGEDIADHMLNLAPSCETCNAGAHKIDQMAFDLLLAGLRLEIAARR